MANMSKKRFKSYKKISSSMTMEKMGKDIKKMKKTMKVKKMYKL